MRSEASFSRNANDGFLGIFRAHNRAESGEVWRDNDALFVAVFPGNLDFVRVEHGNPLGTAIGGGATTYGTLTVGFAIKPPVPKELDGLVLRPEIRYDTSLNGTTPFGAGTKAFAIHVRRRHHHHVQNQMIAARGIARKSGC